MKTEKEIVEAYLDAINRHDIDAEMSLYAEDVTNEVVGYFSKTGKSALRQLGEYGTAINNNFHFHGYTIEKPGQVSFKVTQQNEVLRTFGVDELRYASYKMTIRNGLITSIRTELSQESLKLVKETDEAFVTWATKEQPEAFAAMTPGDEFIHSKKNGLAVMALLREWQTAQA